MDNENFAPKAVTSLPVLLDFNGDGKGGTRPGRFGAAGWTVYAFTTPREAARFFLANQESAMSCWLRMDVIDGELMQVR